ncbi:MAG TPA: Na+/H+ antiporter subunit A [Propionibacteriaceae bacterium]|nr:Na+/H+ antiporter subunit A [Propionibacteriaceae bacterium]
MLATLIAAHVASGMLAPLLSRVLHRWTYLVLAILPAVTFGWLVSQGPAIMAGDVRAWSVTWIPSLGVHIDLRLGFVQWALALVVSGIGALVLAYCRWYFGEASAARTGGLLTAFAGAMLLLATTDDLIILYVAWELTTVFSYLLIAHDPSRRANRAAAMTALIVTTTGGLAMLVGLITLGAKAGTYSLSGLLADPPQGVVAGIAALLVLVGALSKSALVPFHFWLPGAMAAPTPVSAYLHAATMVKAGVYLVAVMAPAFAGVPGWRLSVSILGVATMVIGGWRSLRQTDLKLLLAYGTVSQLGFMVLLMGVGTKGAALAGMGMTLAHALFKGALFLIVGVVDHSAGTRDLTKLTGVGRRMPFVAAAGALAAASMAGLPPLFGFVAKESAYEALVDLNQVSSDAATLPPLIAWLLVVGVVFASAITLAYSLRFWWGAFADKPGVAAPECHHNPAGLVIPPFILAGASLVFAFLGKPLTWAFTPYANTLPDGELGSGLALWHGLTLELGLSAIAVALGVLLFWQRDRISAVQATFPPVEGADVWYQRNMQLVDRLAVEITARAQRGSVSHYVSIILTTAVVLVAAMLLPAQRWPMSYRLWDTPAQLLAGGVTVLAALFAATARGRIKAVLLVGVTGYGTATLFLLHGAPDLALTQMLVETVSVVVFLLVLRTLPKYFTTRPLLASRWWRVVLAGAVGLMVTLLVLYSAGSRVAVPVSIDFHAAAYEFGYGLNIVNVLLVDTRAWDTIGEISVLVIAATGVASLIHLRSRAVGVDRAEVRRHRATAGHRGWLASAHDLSPMDKSVVVEVTTRLLFPVMMVVSVYLLLAGHNAPGGGFAGGLVGGMALIVRYLAAGRGELDHAAPYDAGKLLGAGLVVAFLSAVVPALAGGRIFQSYDIYITVPALEYVATPWGQVELLGKIHLVSSTAFDIGVYLIVMGVLLDIGRSLGKGIDEQAADDIAPLPYAESARALPAGAARPDGVSGQQLGFGGDS